MSIGPGPESVGIELYAHSTIDSRWDRGVWDGQRWDSPAWQAIGCQVLEVDYRAGASEEAGVLTVSSAGMMDVRTYDPDRLLDPLATTSPYFGAVRTGTPIRLVGLVPGSIPAWTGFLDEGRYELGTSEGRLRAIDGIAYLAQSEVPDATVLPNTLRARVRAVVAAVGLTDLVPVDPEVADMDPDPAVSAFDGKAASAWTIILAAALDCLWYVWLGPLGVLRFASLGSLPDAPFGLGCAPPEAGGATWIAGLASLESTSQAEPIRNAVRWQSSAGVWATPAKDAGSIATYGERRLEIPRVVPTPTTWSARILADRADAGLQVFLGEVRPYSLLELGLLLQGNSAGPSTVRVYDDDHGEPVDLSVGLLGTHVGVTDNGWRFAFVTTIPRAEWEAEVPPVVPPTPPAGTYHTEVRSYIATSDALLALTSGGAKYGAGAATTLPVGAWQGWTYRSLIQFPAIPWTGIRRLISASLNLRSTTQVRVGFGSSPTIEVRRITGAWSAGSASSPSGSNAVVYPGPAVASTTVRKNVTSSPSTAQSILVSGLAVAWAPAAIGGSSAPQRGLALYGGSGSEADTWEAWPVEQGGTSRPSLDLTLEVYD